MRDREARVRDEAYRIWVERGRPEGGEQDHWLEAERRVAETEGGFGGNGAAKATGPAKAVVRNAGDSGVAAPKAAVAKPKTEGKPKAPSPSKGTAVDVVPARKPAARKPAAKSKPATKPKA